MLSIEKSVIERSVQIGDLFNEFGFEHVENIEAEATSDIEILTPVGFKKIEGFRTTETLPIRRVKFDIEENEYLHNSLDAADEHIVMTMDGWKKLVDVNESDKVATHFDKGYDEFVKVSSNELTGESDILYDLQVADVHCFYANGFLSHNSHFLVNKGANALKVGKNVLHYTFELTETAVGIRYDSHLCSIPSNEVQDRKDEIKKKYEDMELGRLIIKEYPTGFASVITLRSHIEKLMMKGFRPSVILVDYADIMRSTRHYDSMRHELKLIYEELRNLSQDINVPIWTACFHGDTVIASPSGKFKIKDKVGQGGFPVFAYDHEQGRVVLKTVKSVYKSGVGQELWKVTLDNGKEIIVTPTHNFMMRTGEYRMLQDLKVGDSLMPYYRRMKDGRKQIYRNDGTWEHQYRMVGEWKFGEIPKYHQIHHKDFDKFNDHPDNLEMLTISEHYHIHGKESWKPDNPCGIDHLREVYSERMKQSNPMGTREQRIEQHANIAQKCDSKSEFLQMTKGIPLRSSDKAKIWQEKIEHHNHKIKQIEFYGYDDVYNMEVEELHNYALDAGIFVKNSQANREAANADVVGLENMAEAYGKAMVADVVITLSRKAQEKSTGFGRMFVAKNRAGRDGLLFHVKMDTSMSRIEVINPEEEQTLGFAQDETASDIKDRLRAKWQELKAS